MLKQSNNIKCIQYYVILSNILINIIGRNSYYSFVQ